MLVHRVNSEGLRGRANAPRGRRTQEDLYRVQPRFLSTFPSAKNRKKAAIFAGFRHCFFPGPPPVRNAGAPCERPRSPANSLFICPQRRTAATFVKRSLRNPSGCRELGVSGSIT